MNKKQFEAEKRRVIGLLDTTSYRPIDGVIRFSLGEGFSHYIAKCKIVWMLKEGILPEYLDEAMNRSENGLPYDSLRERFPVWATPFIITEARFSSKLRTDVLYHNIYGTYAIEIADSESGKSLKIKAREYMNMGLNFVSIEVSD